MDTRRTSRLAPLRSPLTVAALWALAASCGTDATSTLGGGTDTRVGGDTAFTPDAPSQDVATVDTPSSGADTQLNLDASTTPDVEEDVFTPEEGGLGWACESNDECGSGWCVPSANGRVCSVLCIDTCEAGYQCKLVVAQTGTDDAYICVPLHVHLCDPCTSNADCTKDGAPEGSKCVSRGDDGSFCGVPCGGASECPSGYTCEAGQCAPSSGQCRCSALAVAQSAHTDCAVTNVAGSCGGTRTCADVGLSSCDAQIPAKEICDQLDNDCDDKVDEDCDGDGVEQDIDNCPLVANPDQLDTDGDNTGNACDNDDDGDNVPDDADCQPLLKAVHAGAPEVCDQLDNDCDGETDEGLCSDGNPCTDDICGDNGECLNLPNTDPCDDGDVCTTKDACSPGGCVGSGAKDCSDGNPCTTDTCDPVTGCGSVPAAGPCSDGDACTTGDLCVDGVCKGGAQTDCNDSNQCTDDGCGPSGCTHTATNPCDDGDVCTQDLCKPAACEHPPASGSCNDGSVCTQVDLCQGGKCVGGSNILCDDGNPCTNNTCDSQTGCVYPNNNAGCEDGNQCTGPDVCQEGKCKTGPAVSCDDNNVCTMDSCSPVAGCQHQTTNPCTDGNPCTDDICQPGVGCTFPNNSLSCNDDSVCTTGDKCQGGTCAGTGTLSCSDNNPCTDDACNPTSGCYWVNNNKPCTDNNACTITDTCQGGSCIGAGALNCNDNNPCTNDSCQAVGGCVHANNNGGCDDGDTCTVNDKCAGGSCTGGSSACPPQAGCLITTCLDIGVPLCLCL